MDKTSGVIILNIKEKEYKLCFDFNAICWFEDQFDESFDELQIKMVENTYKISDIRKLIACGLQINAINEGKEEMSFVEVKQLISGVNPVILLDGIMAGLEEPTIQ